MAVSRRRDLDAGRRDVNDATAATARDRAHRSTYVRGLLDAAANSAERGVKWFKEHPEIKRWFKDVYLVNPLFTSGRVAAGSSTASTRNAR